VLITVLDVLQYKYTVSFFYKLKVVECPWLPTCIDVRTLNISPELLFGHVAIKKPRKKEEKKVSLPVLRFETSENTFN